MKNHLLQTPEPAVSVNNTTSLYKLVNKLQLSLLSRATARKSFIINDIDKLVTVTGGEHMLAYVIGSLLIHTVYSSKASCIRIENKLVENKLQIRIKNNNKILFAHNSYENLLDSLVYDVEKSGGFIGLEHDEQQQVTIVFSPEMD